MSLFKWKRDLWTSQNSHWYFILNSNSRNPFFTVFLKRRLVSVTWWRSVWMSSQCHLQWTNHVYCLRPRSINLPSCVGMKMILAHTKLDIYVQSIDLSGDARGASFWYHGIVNKNLFKCAFYLPFTFFPMWSLC